MLKEQGAWSEKGQPSSQGWQGEKEEGKKSARKEQVHAVFVFFSQIFKNLFIYLKVRVTEKKRESIFLSIDSLPNDQSLELHPGLQHGQQDPQYLGHPLLLMWLNSVPQHHLHENINFLEDRVLSARVSLGKYPPTIPAIARDWERERLANDKSACMNRFFQNEVNITTMLYILLLKFLHSKLFSFCFNPKIL